MLEHAFFQDLAILMFAAGIVAVVFSRFGWPKVIGYLLAGVLMSEYTWGGGFLVDVGTTKTIGQLGVVFLMFAMGLSFSAKEMSKIKGVVLPCAILDTLVMIWLGYTIGTGVFGWTPGQSVFLGVAICDSATTLLAKVIDEMGWSSRPFTKCVLGASVCEDIICVGAIAVATGFAQGDGMSVRALGKSLGELTLFFLSVIVFGLILIPRLLESVARRKDNEALVLAVLGVCFFVSFIAYHFDFSLALGAFMVGLLGSSSVVRDRLMALVDPLKSMFAAVFFVSIGLLVDPLALWHCLPQILLVSAVIVVVKFLNNTVASLAAGQDIKTAVQTGFALAQIGEFAFMVAILYDGLAHEANGEFFTIAIGASLLTTVLNPFMVRISDPVGDWAVRRTPERFKRVLAAYDAWIDKLGTSVATPAFARLRTAAIKLGVYAGLMMSVAVICSMLHSFDYSRFSVTFERYDEPVFVVVANVFALSLLPMVIAAARTIAEAVAAMLVGDGGVKWEQSFRQMISFVVQVVVVVAFFAEWAMLNSSVLPSSKELKWVSLAIIGGVALFGWRFMVKAGRRATSRFKESLTAEERREGLARMRTISIPEGAYHNLRLDANSPAIGETVVTLNIRAKTGAMIAALIRDGQTIRNLGPHIEFRIGDELVATGERTQIAALKDLLGVV